jgi:hypothetical protein
VSLKVPAAQRYTDYTLRQVQDDGMVSIIEIDGKLNYKDTNKSYTIEILKSQYPFLDGIERLGVYCFPLLLGR